MTVTKTTVKEEHVRTDNITISGEDDLYSQRHHFSDELVPFIPDLVVIRYRRASDRDPWRVCSVIVSGLRRRKDGEVGKATGALVWAAEDIDSMPEWVATVVKDAVATAHADRVAFTSRPVDPATNEPPAVRR